MSHLAEGWFVVQSRAAVSMSASSDFKIEGTIDPGTKRQSQHEHIVHFGLVTVDKVRDLRNIVSKTQTQSFTLCSCSSVFFYSHLFILKNKTCGAKTCCLFTWHTSCGFLTFLVIGTRVCGVVVSLYSSCLACGNLCFSLNKHRHQTWLWVHAKNLLNLFF